ncbi:hypothetical protein PYW08_009190 [Mythimna loreyi]|uniref:Uncharacterized protein n=1 Tax=Mythimna loreyi TaxID=667449 RepID=A0ACC2Q842_9NEOP|nr:hypothetical protein PYW08_009190 [Mythimna loreyi]
MSDPDDDNIVRYGTQLDPYEEDELPSKRKYQQAPDQFAVDEHGRRRFHGAFTGGFSAGFGNTVGSQEGWTPSTFKSSRAEKASFSNQRPEDFMDEEDRGEFGIAPRQVQTQREFSGQKRPHRTQFHDGPIPGEPVLHSLVRAVHETAAVRMLRAMGWKEGQGTGERLSAKGKKKAKDQHKVYGCYIPPEFRQGQEDDEQAKEESDSSDSEFDFDTLFAPDDYEPYILNRKNDRFGLGYSGLSRHSVLGNLTGEYGSEAGSSRSHLLMKDKGKRVSIRGQAFGVGAFEAEDEDIYAKEDMSHYDFSIGGPAPVTPKKNTVQKTGHVLPGFVKATAPFPSVPSYPAPALPRDYVPAAAGARRSRFEPTTEQPRDQGLGRHELSAKARGELLGEAPVPPPTAPPPPTPAEDPIAKLVGRNVNFVTYTEKTELDFIPIKDSGKELTRVFKPFVGNPEKQKRYEQFVENKGVLERDGETDKLKEWEREREMAEFEQAAKLYRPLSGVMGDRFTHASEPDEATNPLSAVARSSTNHGLASKEQREAAEKGVYGVMTRQQTSWRPEALVCKRFNVPEVGGPRIEQKKEDRPKVAYSVFSYLESSVHDKDSFAKEQSKFSGSRSLTTSILPKTNEPAQKTNQENKSEQNNDENKKITEVSESAPGFSKRITVAELFLKESEKTKNQGAEVTETINKFDKMDLYKSIFLSDTEDEDDSKDTTNKNNEGQDFIDVPKNVERNTSPPRGIFANIDFDELNSWRRAPEESKKVEPPNKNTETPSNKVESPKANEDNATYGPKIPENLQTRILFEPSKKLIETVSVSSSEDSWVDINEVKSKKHKKKKSKKHKSKHSKKSKSKKKKDR